MSKQHFPLMPKATAMWLVDNTTLTFTQIAEFCGLHELQVKAMADGDAGSMITPTNPLYNGELDQAEIDRCQKNTNAKLHLKKSDLPQPAVRAKGPRYTPIAKRDDKPNGIAWLLKNHPELGDSQIVRLIGTTKDTIQKVRDRSHWNANNIKPSNPVLLGLCKQADLDASLRRAQRKQERLGIAPTANANAAEYEDDSGEAVNE
jgi:hypothetical protein